MNQSVRRKLKNPNLPFRLGAVRHGRCRIALSEIVRQDVRGRDDLKKARCGGESSNRSSARSAMNKAVRIGNQTAGRVVLFLTTDDVLRDFRAYQENGVVFVRGPRQEPNAT